MPKDVVVVVNIDAKPSGTENLDILLLSTEGAKDVAVYRDLDVIKEAFTGKKVAAMAEALFEQGKTTLAETLIRKVKIAGIAAPSGSGETEKASALVQAVETLRETDDDWYILLTDQDGDEAVKALCAWAEATEPTEAELGAGEEDHRKLYFGRTQNKSLAVTNRRSIVIYGDQDEEYPDAAYVGNVGPFYPESVTWKFKRPQGLTVPDLTNAERDALEEANVNFLTVEYKREYVKNGVCADGEFIDVQMGADYIAKNMRENLYDIFLENPTIGYPRPCFYSAVELPDQRDGHQWRGHHRRPAKDVEERRHHHLHREEPHQQPCHPAAPEHPRRQEPWGLHVHGHPKASHPGQLRGQWNGLYYGRYGRCGLRVTAQGNHQGGAEVFLPNLQH